MSLLTCSNSIPLGKKAYYFSLASFSGVAALAGHVAERNIIIIEASDFDCIYLAAHTYFRFEGESKLMNFACVVISLEKHPTVFGFCNKGYEL